MNTQVRSNFVAVAGSLLVVAFGTLSADSMPPIGDPAGDAKSVLEADTDARLSAMEYQLKQMRDEMAQLRQLLQQLHVKPIDRPDPKPEIPPRLDTVGTLVMRNWTGAYQDVTVNGQRYNAPPGRSEVVVPLGAVTVNLTWFESPKQMNRWAVSGGRHEMVCDIRY